VAEWKLEKKLAEWASDWGVAEVKAPTGAEICQALFRQSSCSSGHASRRSRTARWCSYVPAAAETRGIYLQGASSFKLPKGHFTVSVHLGL
jgi:hypothetical protein